MTDRQVEQAMDLQPQRIASMMFVRTQKTDEQGQPKVDPATGKVETEEDE